RSTLVRRFSRSCVGAWPDGAARATLARARGTGYPPAQSCCGPGGSAGPGATAGTLVLRMRAIARVLTAPGELSTPGKPDAPECRWSLRQGVPALRVLPGRRPPGMSSHRVSECATQRLARELPPGCRVGNAIPADRTCGSPCERGNARD